MLALAALGLGLRLAFFSGFGLGDDIILRHAIGNIVEGHIQPDNQAYRFVWWLPTVILARLFGLGEPTLIAPIVTIATIGTMLVYAFGFALWGRAGAVIATLLLLVHPLDFAWSTMLSSDIFFSVAAGGCFLLALRATQVHDPLARRRCWRGAAVCLLLAYHAKVSAALLFPALVLFAWTERRQIDRTATSFLGTTALLFGISAAVSFALTGDPLAPLHSEISAQGLEGPVAVKFHELTRDVFWTFPRWLFFPEQFGNWVFHVYAPLLVAFGALGWLLGLRSRLFLLWWLACLFLGMQLNLQRVEGHWVVGFRNYRHGHVWIYPMILLLTGYLVGLHARFPRLARVFVVALLAFGLWQSIATARLTQVSFRDRRQACRFLRTQPPGPIHSDFQIGTWCLLAPMPGFSYVTVESFDRPKRRAELAAIRAGYLVTGGGREPHYGCIDCIPLASEIDPAQWELLFELPGPATPTVWRPEALRIWHRRPLAPDATAVNHAPP